MVAIEVGEERNRDIPMVLRVQLAPVRVVLCVEAGGPRIW